MTTPPCPVCLGTGWGAMIADVIPSIRSVPPPKCETCDGTGILNDRDLVAAYHQTTGEPGDPLVEALIGEIQVRNLDL